MDASEKLLITKSKNGDILAFEQLLSLYEKKAYNIAFRMMRNEEDAKDAVQEAFIKVFKSMKSFREESSFSTWLYRIVTNVCLDELRKRKKYASVSLEFEIESDRGTTHIELDKDEVTPEDLYERQEKKELVLDTINSLKEDYKTVVILRDIQGFSYEEIATILSCSLGTIKSRINRARNVLKDKLQAQMEL
ncbi:MAG: sigma-70 family RNA polymerase sigma factor [Clostridiales bacterium]|jgi:RNA polymerase sigma-70 factor (ECF subfamily)|nr:sigma-70 family RNA polymerase sigma factor [Clostridiales bacterium]